LLFNCDLLSLQERRKHLRLVFLFKVVEGSVPAIPPEDYLIPPRPKCAVRACENFQGPRHLQHP